MTVDDLTTVLHFMVSRFGETVFFLTWMFSRRCCKELPGLDSLVFEGEGVAAAALLRGGAAGTEGQRHALITGSVHRRALHLVSVETHILPGDTS